MDQGNVNTVPGPQKLAYLAGTGEGKVNSQIEVSTLPAYHRLPESLPWEVSLMSQISLGSKFLLWGKVAWHPIGFLWPARLHSDLLD